MKKTTEKRPLSQHRRAQIADLIRAQDSVRVDDLADRFGVSQVTIRNDLGRLERDGHLIRDHGGAIHPSNSRESALTISSLPALHARSSLHVDEKRRIGASAAQLVEVGDTIIMDAGTTVVEMAHALKNISPLTVVSNALNVAVHIEALTNANLIMLGGMLNRESTSTLGPIAETVLADLVVNKLFLGAQAWNMEDGLTDTTMEIAQVKRAMIKAARQVILLADSSKFGSAGFIKVAPLSEVHTVVTDAGLPAEARSLLEKAGIEVVIA